MCMCMDLLVWRSERHTITRITQLPQHHTQKPKKNSARSSSPEFKLVALALLEHLGLDALVATAPAATAGN